MVLYLYPVQSIRFADCTFEYPVFDFLKQRQHQARGTKGVGDASLPQNPDRQFPVDLGSCIFFIALGVVLAIHFFGSNPTATVGDKLTFDSKQLTLNAYDLVVPARIITEQQTPSERTCRLDVSVIASQGGIAEVLNVSSAGVFLLWTGGKTASGAADCGPAAQILVSNADYRRLLSIQVPTR